MKSAPWRDPTVNEASRRFPLECRRGTNPQQPSMYTLVYDIYSIKTTYKHQPGVSRYGHFTGPQSEYLYFIILQWENQVFNAILQYSKHVYFEMGIWQFFLAKVGEYKLTSI